MKYKDQPDKSVNGYYVGERVGSPTPDFAGIENEDGYSQLREAEHVGTITPDAKDTDFPEEV